MKPVVFRRWREMEPVVRSSTGRYYQSGWLLVVGGSVEKSLSEDAGIVLLRTRRADTVRKLRLRSPRDVFLEAFPFAGFIPDVLAERAYREQSFEHFHLTLKLALEFGETREPQREKDDDHAT